MATYSMLTPYEKKKIMKLLQEELDLTEKQLAIIENMKRPFQHRKNEVQAFLRNERTLEQLQKTLSTKVVFESESMSPAAVQREAQQ